VLKETGAGIRVFISYASPDVQFASMLTQSLERDEFDVFFAPRDIMGGEDWQDALAREMDQAGKIVVVISSSSSSGNWLDREVKRAIDRYSHKIVPILIDETISFEDTLDALDRLNPFLRQIQFIDFRVPQHIDSAYDMLVQALRS
jgi:hypothetical protein